MKVILNYSLFAGNRDGGRVPGRRQLRHLPAVRRAGAPLEQLLEHLPRTEGHPVTTTTKQKTGPRRRNEIS